MGRRPGTAPAACVSFAEGRRDRRERRSILVWSGYTNRSSEPGLGRGSCAGKEVNRVGAQGGGLRSARGPEEDGQRATRRQSQGSPGPRMIRTGWGRAGGKRVAGRTRRHTGSGYTLGAECTRAHTWGKAPRVQRGCLYMPVAQEERHWDSLRPASVPEWGPGTRKAVPGHRPVSPRSRARHALTLVCFFSVA